MASAVCPGVRLKLVKLMLLFLFCSGKVLHCLFFVVVVVVVIVVVGFFFLCLFLCTLFFFYLCEDEREIVCV